MLDSLISDVTIGESYFFRDPAQMDVLRSTVLPQLIERKRHSGCRLRIWSAGCARGQELYTLYMLLTELLPDMAQWSLQLLGTDINQAFLAEAREGGFHPWSLRSTPARLRERHFQQMDNVVQIESKARQACAFQALNLVNEDRSAGDWPGEKQDLILCRNVLIYFDADTASKVVGKLADSLAQDGVLMLGAADRVQGDCEALSLINAEGSQYYRHAERPLRRSGAKPQTPAARPIATLRQRPVIAANAGVPINPTICEAIPALMAMANSGDLPQALALGQSLVDLYPTAKEVHLMIGMLYAEQGDRAAAKSSWQRALFLDLNYFEAQWQLGMCALREGHTIDAKRHLHNALHIAQQMPPDAVPVFDPDRSYRQLAEALSTELPRLCAS
jgi:chemotaxis protein methyltransferase CheR